MKLATPEELETYLRAGHTVYFRANWTIGYDYISQVFWEDYKGYAENEPEFKTLAELLEQSSIDFPVTVPVITLGEARALNIIEHHTIYGKRLVSAELSERAGLIDVVFSDGSRRKSISRDAEVLPFKDTYAVLTALHNGRYDDDGTTDGKPARYETEQEAQAEIDDIIATWKADNADECESLAYTQDDFLIVKTEEIARHL